MMLHIILCLLLFLSPATQEVSLTSFGDQSQSSNSSYHLPGATSITPRSAQEILEGLLVHLPAKYGEIQVFRVAGNEIRAHTDEDNIYVTRGLSRLMGNDASVIASVLAHELGHIISGHLQLKKSRDERHQLLLKGSHFMQGIFTFEIHFLRNLLKKRLDSSEIFYTRSQEREADAIGAMLAFEAGYDPLLSIYMLDVVQLLSSKELNHYLQYLIPMVKKYQIAINRHKYYSFHYVQTLNSQSKIQAAIWDKAVEGYWKQIQDFNRMTLSKSHLATSRSFSSHPKIENRKNIIKAFSSIRAGRLSYSELQRWDENLASIYRALS